MARPRQPLSRAKTAGADIKNPKRFRGRAAPLSRPLGEPSAFISQHGRFAWDCFKTECPWLKEAHRALMEVASQLRGEIIAGGEMSAAKLTLYRLCLTLIGATPADETKINVDPEAPEDPADRFFH